MGRVFVIIIYCQLYVFVITHVTIMIYLLTYFCELFQIFGGFYMINNSIILTI